ncbi:hypothetical protein VFPFJ_10220 [Purpureocillium lilacinum]|uniref:Uncharacterized protein n=1 Tax=Purpureocillium lilacinum TaxID=33203 RepID=A0A179GKL8_PURLI|nr:hypothetical protein VFPFJ_10220 [Purpureocillium lilacinum]OAQ77853.1 hypothetical protein VFPFJ_10220 [Purpureocillium lilacinum]
MSCPGCLLASSPRRFGSRVVTYRTIAPGTGHSVVAMAVVMPSLPY